MTDEDRRVFEELEQRLKTLLPVEYRDRYENVQPVSMGSAGVHYGAGGKIAWDQMWGSFCDLAMAGGPPHKRTLLRPGTVADIAANADRYDAVVGEICRGIGMVTELAAAPSPSPGWLRVECLTRGMAGWLVRAISMENVAVRADDVMLELPAGPDFQDLKEIKNVITVIAKTTHYWVDHMPVMQRQEIATLLDGMNEESPLVAPVYAAAPSGHIAVAHLSSRLGNGIARDTGLRSAPDAGGSWRGIECPTAHAAVWMMRMMVTVNILSRREGPVLYVPVNPEIDSDGEIVGSSVALVHRVARMEGTL